MMHNRIIRIARLTVLALALATVVAGCASTGTADTSVTDEANANRQYMASLNSQMAGLQDVMDEFQVALSEGNTVVMQSQIDKCDAIIDKIEAGQPTDNLADAKGQYVDALKTLDGAMKDYVSLYSDAEKSLLSAQDVSSRMDQIQSAYNDGIEKLEKADEAVNALSQG